MKVSQSSPCKILSIICLAVFSTFIFLGCASEHPEADIQTYCEAVAHLDDASAKKLKISTDDIKNTSLKQARQTMSMMAQGAKDNGQLSNLCDTMYNTMKRLNIKTELVSKTSDTAKVKVTTDYIDYGELVRTAAPKIQAEITANSDEIMALPREQQMSKVLDYSSKCLIDALNSAEVKGQQSFEVDCKLDKDLNMWIPEQTSSFEKNLVNNMLFPQGNQDTSSAQ